MDDVQNEPQSFEIQNDSAPATEEGTVNGNEADNPKLDAEPQEPKIVFDDAQQGKVNELIGGKVAKQRAAEQRAEAAEQKLAQYESQAPKPKAPDVPDMPDPDDFFDDNAGYQTKIAERDAAIEKRAEFNAQQKMADSQQQAFTQQQAAEKAQEQQKQQETYVGAAESFGIKPEQVQKDAATVSQYLSSDIQDFIVSDPQGPLISNFLSNDLVELDKIRAMHPLNASIYIANTIKPKLVGIRKTTKTPAPNNVSDGSNVSEKADPRLAGVTYT